MKTILLLKWLPASGKSTRAKEMVKNNPWHYKRVNKDDLRSLIDVSHWSKANEKFVLKVRDFIVTEALKEGKHVIVDDTNFELKHEERMREIAKENGAVVEIKFFDIDIEECIKRDLQRPNSVGEKVIRGMYNKYLKKVEPIQQDESLPKAVIFDVDWTLAIMKDRSPYDWHKVWNDEPNRVVCHLAVTYKDLWYKVIVFTWRDWVCERETKERLKKQCIRYDYFDIRPQWDTRKDAVVKKEMLDKVKDHYNIIWVFDDRDQVVRMWRDLWLTCFQVAEWDF